MEFELIALLTLGFSFGLLHALDADHVMAVSTMASNQHGAQHRARATILFCARWALGHGGMLCMLAALLLAFNVVLPEVVNLWAEKTVGIILIGLGLWIFWSFRRNKVSLRVHSHGDHVHAHLAEEGHGASSANSAQTTQHKSDHSPVLIGLTHGLAGSAPVLALLPTLEVANEMWGFVYVLLFSFGVLCTMVLFGLGFGFAQARLLRYSASVFEYSRMLIASISIGFGACWLFA